MDYRNHFRKWLEKGNKSKQTITKYMRNIERISEELSEYTQKEINLYKQSSPIDIDRIKQEYFSIDIFKEKDLKRHREYSSALSNYKSFAEDLEKNQSFRAGLLIEEEKYQINIVNALKFNHIDQEKIIDKPVEKPEYMKIGYNKIWKRNPNLASKAVANSHFLCEFDNNHQHFISRFNQKNYVEAHHIIPMKFQEEFNISLDVHANIISLCLICHKKLHYGTFSDKEEILEKIYMLRIERLNACGIFLTVDDLYDFYKE